MNKRTFLKICSAAINEARFYPGWQRGLRRRNSTIGRGGATWMEYGTDRVYSPVRWKRCARVCPHAKQAEGVGHAPLLQSHCPTAAINFFRFKAMDKVVELNVEARTVTIESGMSYGKLCTDSGEQRLGRCTIWRHCRTFPWRAHARRLHTALCEERQPVQACFGAGDRERGGRSG